jgi:hypothetical protein
MRLIAPATGAELVVADEAAAAVFLERGFVRVEEPKKAPAKKAAAKKTTAKKRD